jgi:glycosyltransferase involved in cell wall biosynthesis
VIIHQILAGAGPHDAVTGQALAYRARFAAWGWGGHDHATYILPGLNGAVRPRAALAPDPRDVLLIHHAAVAPQLDQLLALPNRKVLVYHNVTPPSWLWDQAPTMAVQCAVGREQLPALASAADVAIGVSAFNAAELAAAGAADPRVVPLVIDLDRLGAPDPTRSGPGDPQAPRILVVGRLSPHKRQDEAMRAFALYRRLHAPDAVLTLVGDAVSVAYGQYLREQAAAIAPEAIRFEHGLSDAELGRRYRQADALLSLSEHEGFCLPLIEALHFGVPVVAREAAAVGETLAGAGLMAGPADDLAVIAELLHLALTDASLRAELARRGRERVTAYAPDRVTAALRAALEPLSGA